MARIFPRSGMAARGGGPIAGAGPGRARDAPPWGVGASRRPPVREEAWRVAEAGGTTRTAMGTTMGTPTGAAIRAAPPRAAEPGGAGGATTGALAPDRPIAA